MPYKKALGLRDSRGDIRESYRRVYHRTETSDKVARQQMTFSTILVGAETIIVLHTRPSVHFAGSTSLFATSIITYLIIKNGLRASNVCFSSTNCRTNPNRRTFGQVPSPSSNVWGRSYRRFLNNHARTSCRDQRRTDKGEHDAVFISTPVKDIPVVWCSRVPKNRSHRF